MGASCLGLVMFAEDLCGKYAYWCELASLGYIYDPNDDHWPYGD